MSGQKILFVDRDGTLIAEPPDFQIDAYAKLHLLPDVIPALLRLRDAGYQFVMVTNQDGLGTASFPQADFDGPHALMLEVFASQGISFREVLIDASLPEDKQATRKPGVDLVLHYLRDRKIDLQHSAMVGDRATDIEFARNLGVRGFLLAHDGENWNTIADALCTAHRIAQVERSTRETQVRVDIDLDRMADPVIVTGHGFFDHMLEQLGKHAGISLSVRCAGDLHIDEHHTVEDCALAIGEALRNALGDKRGIDRYGFSDDDGLTATTSATTATSTGNVVFTLPMDEALASAAMDLSGRAYFVFDGAFPRSEVGGLATELVPHFFRSLCDAAGINLHLRVRGENTHHMVEACFKVVARAMRMALRREGNALASTKGSL
ncbi:MAG TPA: bifunctional histidinol-phosphatase/imidazoleglycerol-phosphate dehydratase HisB [Xanthomonadaceae bacterium]|nr:bifunctional histidinol-phosphatase/imidazoleglycerol-phosphate dehydratase HisB [Xanthomonadaceae bacterium]